MSSSQVARPKFNFVLTDELRILVTDDDPIMREFARVHLSTPTADVETAESGEDGLTLLETRHFDIAMVDLDMPGMGGLEMIRQIRLNSKLRHLPVVVVTSNDDIVSIDRAYDAGATSFATKPVNWRLLSYQLRYVLRAQGLIAA